jgi:hypothetical protein
MDRADTAHAVEKVLPGLEEEAAQEDIRRNIAKDEHQREQGVVEVLSSLMHEQPWPDWTAVY